MKYLEYAGSFLLKFILMWAAIGLLINDMGTAAALGAAMLIGLMIAVAATLILLSGKSVIS